MSDLLLKAPLQYEPLKNNRWLLRFPTDIGIQSWQLKSCDAPKVNIGSVEIPFLNTSTFVQGRYLWQEMNIKLNSYQAPSTAQALIEWMRLGVESVTGRMGYTIGHSKNLQLEMLDPTGAAVQLWDIKNAIIVGDVDFGGSLDYSSEDVQELSFTIQPQYCVQVF